MVRAVISSFEIFAGVLAPEVVTKTSMNKVLRVLGRIVLVALLFAVGAIAYSTWSGHTRWYFRVSGQVLVDGHETTGYMHANTDKTLLLVTRTDEARPETYLVFLGATHRVLDCGEWHPLRFLPFPVGDVNPPCTVSIVDPAKVHDRPASANVTTGRNFIEFSSKSGKKVRAQW